MKGRIPAVIDVETTPMRDGETPRTLFWGLAIEGEHYRRWATTGEALAYVRTRPDVTYYFHHDYEICQMLADGFTPDSMRTRGSRVIRANVAGTQWINSFALFNDKLESILETAGFKKLPLNWGDHPLGCYCKNCQQALSNRNYSDTVEAMVAFRRLSVAFKNAFGVDPIEEGIATMAGCSFRAAKLRAGDLPRDLEWRGAYRGGRVECLRLGSCGDADCFDINSSYPFAFTDAPESDVLVHARVCVDTRGASPFFRYLEEPEPDERKFLFPRGTYETVFFASNYERYIRPILRRGVLQSITPLYKERVDLRWVKNVGPLMQTAYKRRQLAKQTGDKCALFILKHAMAACYGRIGMKPEREVCAIVDRLPVNQTVRYRQLPNDKFLTFRDVYMGGTDANYKLAAWITDNARARLYSALASSDSYYCDTDSVYCRPGSFSAGACNVPATELGGWKREDTANLAIESVKDYCFGKAVKRKGGASFKRWTIKVALDGKGVKTIHKTRKTTYDARQVWGDGSTTPRVVYD
jgi:hypothetical protein